MPIYTSVGTAFYFVGSGGYVPPVQTNGLFGMGLNTYGSLGNNSVTSRSSPVTINTSTWNTIIQGTNAGGAASNNGITLAIKNDNTLWGWGRNYTGMFGGTTLQDYISSPVQIGSNTWSTVAVIGVDSAIGIDTTGKMFTWGRNVQGSELGYYGSTGSITFTKLDSISLMNTGSAWGWGINSIRNLISGDNLTRSYPVQIDSATTLNWGMTWLDIATSGGANTSNLRAVGITRDTRLWSWGGGIHGGLGLGDTITRSSITQIGTDTGWSKVVVCSQAGITDGIAQGALKSDGTLWMWGLNTYGLLGQGDTINRSSPVQVPGTWTTAAVGRQTTFGIRNDGTLWGWGTGFYLGTSDKIDRSSPVQIGVDTNWIYVWSGLSQMFAIKNDGKLFAWGLGTAGQLGLGDTIARSSPVQVAAGTSFTQVVSSYQGSNAITNDGKLYGWGGNYHGDTVTRSIPVQIGSSSWTLLGAGGFSSIGDTYGLTTAGTIFGWGSNANYELGDGTITATQVPVSLLVNNYKQYSNSYSPIQIGTSSWASVAANLSRNVYAITSVGALFGWGWNLYGTVGANDTIDRSSPVQIKSGTSFTQVAAPPLGMLALDTSYNLWAAGFNGNGTYGDNSTVTRSSPVQVTTTSNPLLRISVGLNTNVIAVNQGGRLYSWGDNTYSQLGLNDRVNRSSPTQIGFTYSNYTLTGSGLVNDGYNLYTWGTNASGELGISLTTNRSSPVQVSGSYLSVVKNTYNMFAIDYLGRLYASGRNSSGELGLGDIINRSSPVQIGSASWTSVSAGDSGFAIAIRSDGALFSWGKNNVYQLGLNDSVNRSTPTQIGNLSYSKISAGTSNAFAISTTGALYGWGNNTNGIIIPITPKSFLVVIGSAVILTDNTLWMWGSNTNGTLGDNTNTNRSSPVQISGAWKYIARDPGNATSLNSLGIKTNGTLWFWGLGTNGVSGNNDAITSNSPVQIGTDTDWEKCFLSSSYSGFALKTNGLLYSWGLNTFGNLGLNDTINRSSPTQVSATTSWTTISAGNQKIFGITTSGNLYAWGDNSNGELGQNDKITRSSPVQITGTWSSVSAGGSNVGAINSSGSLFTWGYNLNGELGQNNKISCSVPVQVGSSAWVAVHNAHGGYSAIKSGGLLYGWGGPNLVGLGDGILRSSPTQVGSSSWSMLNSAAGYITTGGISGNRLFNWGTNGIGYLGDNSTVTKASPVLTAAASLSTPVYLTVNSPTQIGSSSWTVVTAGDSHVMALRYGDSVLFTWGKNDAGQLGLNDTVTRSSPVQIRSSSYYTRLASYVSTHVIRSDGTLWVWGGFQNGDQGLNNMNITRSSPTQVGTSTWLRVGATQHKTAIRSDGTLWAWGYNNSGGLGVGDVLNRSSPTQIGVLTNWVSIPNNFASGYNMGAAINSSSQLFTWGYNGNGQLGLGNTVNRSSPVQVPGSWTFVQTVTDGLAMINTLGQLFGTGTGYSGELGTNSNPLYVTSPVQVVSDKSFTFVTGGYTRVSSNWRMALATDGTLWSWGGNSEGQLGLGDTISRSSPVQIGSLSWSAIGITSTYVAWGIQDSKLYAWGWGGGGSIPIGDTLDRSSPVQIYSDSSIKWSSVIGGVFGFDNDSYLYGFNATGTTLGLNDTISRSSPVNIGAVPTSWSQVGIGYSYSFGIDTLGRLYSWGVNNTGQLGLNLTGNRSSPVQIGTSSWLLIPSQNTNNTVAQLIDGRIFTWGTNNNGQLGINDTLNRSSPVQVSTSFANFATAVSLPSVQGIRHSGFLYNNKLYLWGGNNEGQLGLDDTVNRSSPVQLTTGVNKLNLGYNDTFYQKP